MSPHQGGTWGQFGWLDKWIDGFWDSWEHAAGSRVNRQAGCLPYVGSLRSFNSSWLIHDFDTIQISQMYGAVQELDLEPQKNSMLARGFGDGNFFISFFGSAEWNTSKAIGIKDELKLKNVLQCYIVGYQYFTVLHSLLHAVTFYKLLIDNLLRRYINDNGSGLRRFVRTLLRLGVF